MFNLDNMKKEIKKLYENNNNIMIQALLKILINCITIEDWQELALYYKELK